MDLVWLFNPFVIFGVALLVGLLLFAWGRALAPPFKPEGHKREMYTGGEAPSKQTVRPGYQFFHIALFFTVFHVAALVLVTAPGAEASWLALAYLGLLALAVYALLGGR